MIILILMKQVGNKSTDFTQSCQHGQEVVVAESALFEAIIQQLTGLLVFTTKEADGWNGALSAILADIEHVSWSSKILEPGQILVEAANGSGVLFPRDHGLVGWERMIGKNLAGALDLAPVDGTLLQSIDIVVTIM